MMFKEFVREVNREENAISNAKAKEEGKAEGKQEAIQALAKQMLQKGYAPDEIISLTGISAEDLSQL